MYILRAALKWQVYDFGEDLRCRDYRVIRVLSSAFSDLFLTLAYIMQERKDCICNVDLFSLWMQSAGFTLLYAVKLANTPPPHLSCTLSIVDVFFLVIEAR